MISLSSRLVAFKEESSRICSYLSCNPYRSSSTSLPFTWFSLGVNKRCKRSSGLAYHTMGRDERWHVFLAHSLPSSSVDILCSRLLLGKNSYFLKKEGRIFNSVSRLCQLRRTLRIPAHRHPINWTFAQKIRFGCYVCAKARSGSAVYDLSWVPTDTIYYSAGGRLARAPVYRSRGPTLSPSAARIKTLAHLAVATQKAPGRTASGTCSALLGRPSTSINGGLIQAANCSQAFPLVAVLAADSAHRRIPVLEM
ncbi:hypothetical protein ACFE04_011463 [Oxalis oulophora]